MSSGGLLLLLGLLTLWAELTPISGEKPRPRPKFCYLPVVTGPCHARIPRTHYNPALNRCQQFIYGGCKGNENNFKDLNQCRYTCV
ncbi:kunitz-type serine protease inhibitor 4-like, partial [Protobothrops mucrosquamatus]|uniref:kunitz-type serine protease inhibitor 4-like n=1 Tax=Protobothrops mucrosquamatus TaxID=103944 RepID=UPI000775AF81